MAVGVGNDDWFAKGVVLVGVGFAEGIKRVGEVALGIVSEKRQPVLSVQAVRGIVQGVVGNRGGLGQTGWFWK